MGFWRALMRGRVREERGAYLILFAIIIVAVFTMVAIVIDLGADRSNVRRNRNWADLASLAGAPALPDGRAACDTAWIYLVANGAVPVGTSSPCSTLPTTCDELNPAANFPRVVTKTIGSSVFTFTFPVLDSDPEMQSQTRIDDGNACERMAVTVRTSQNSLFGGITGASSLSAPGTAVVRRAPGDLKVPVALLLLEPHGCEVLTTGGTGVQIFVHASPPDVGLGIPQNSGRITVDSDGSGATGTACNGGKVIIDANGSSADRVEAWNSCDNILPCPAGVTATDGQIQVFSIQPPAVTCTNTNVACNLNEITPQTAMIDARKADNSFGAPSTLFSRITRAPFDHLYNCRPSGTPYPAYLGIIPIAPCTEKDKPPFPYIDNLEAAVDGASTAPVGSPPVFPNPAAGTLPTIGTWGVIANSDCDVKATSKTYDPVADGVDGYYVNCPTYSVESSGSVTFKGGNVVFQGNVDLNGTFNMNSANATTNLPCLNAPTGPSTCRGGEITQSSNSAAFMYIRHGGALNIATGATVNISKTMTFIKDGCPSGSCKDHTFDIGGGANPVNMTAPTEGPFKNLGLWAESGNTENLAGQANINLEGVFFAPEAGIDYTGQGCDKQLSAQFVSRTLDVTGRSSTENACLNMKPTPGRTVLIPIFGPLLIR